MIDPAPLFRLLYQHVRTQANLPGLTPRPLASKELKGGTSEFVITAGQESPGGGWGSGGLLVPRAYQGYIAVHYAADTDQHKTFTDEAAIFRALTSFDHLPDVQSNNAFRGLGGAPSNWFLNPVPAEAGLPPVLTLAFDFTLEVDLTITETP